MIISARAASDEINRFGGGTRPTAPVRRWGGAMQIARPAH